MMDSSSSDNVKQDLKEAYDAGDFTLPEYLAELRKLRKAPCPLPTTSEQENLDATIGSAQHAPDVELLVDEDGNECYDEDEESPVKRRRVFVEATSPALLAG